MFKQHKWKWIISSLLILLPIGVGLLLWDRLPAQMASHWGVNGEIDGYASKGVFVFLLPAILLLAHWLCLLGTFLDRKNKEQSKKAMGLIFWIMPVISLFANGTVYALSLGRKPNMALSLPLLMGTLFCILGNYMPKCKQNSTIGVKVKWTLENEENWNATHRFTGKVWVAGGIIMFFTAFLPEAVMIPATLVLMLPMVILPFGYSYRYHRSQVAAGTAANAPKKRNKTALWISVVLCILTAAAICFLLFTGEVTLEFQDPAFTVDATFSHSLTVDYAAITDVAYRENLDRGARTNGFGSPRLLTGMFQNEEFGAYTLYSYTGCSAAVIIKADDRTLVIGGKDAAQTQEIYHQIRQRIAKEAGNS